MDFGDEFNNYVVNKLIDYDDNFYFDVVNEPIHRESIVGHRTVDRESLSWHYLLYHDYFIENPIFGPDLFRRRLVCSLKIWMLLSYVNVFHWG
jgi:hypothetical protein